MSGYLGVSGWTKLQKEHPEVKELREIARWLKEFERAEGSTDVPAQSEACNALVKEVTVVEKKVASNKDLAKYLAAMSKEAEAKSRELQVRLKNADEEDEERAGLEKLLLRVRKRDRDKALNFVLAMGRPAGLVITRKEITQAHEKEAKAAREGRGAVLQGICYGEKDRWVFEFVEAPPSGIAKQLKLAALVHAELTIKVLVRGGGVEFDDEMDVESTGDAPSSPVQSTTPVQESPNENRVSGGVAYAKLLLAFDGAKKRLHADLVKLEQAILAEYAGDAELDDVQRRVRRLDEIVATFDDSLKELFDDALNAQVTERAPYHQQALAVVADYRTYLEKSQFVRDVAANPFDVAVSVPLVVQALDAIAKRLA